MIISMMVLQHVSMGLLGVSLVPYLDVGGLPFWQGVGMAHRVVLPLLYSTLAGIVCIIWHPQM